MKVCTKCGLEKEDGEFYKHPRNSQGLNCYCKSCSYIHYKEYRERNKDKLKAERDRYREENREVINKKKIEYYHSNKEKCAAKAKAYREANKEKLKEASRLYREKNREVIREKKRLERLNNKEYIAERKKVEAGGPSSRRQYIKQLPITDEPKFINKVVTVVCKSCGKRMIPTTGQIRHRLSAIKGNMLGEANFYCSESCKDACPLYRFNTSIQTDPRSKLYVPPAQKEEDRGCQTNHLKQIQCDETGGQSYCERCGDFGYVDLHHTHRVGSKDAVSSAGHMLLCAGCHVELHGSCNE